MIMFIMDFHGIVHFLGGIHILCHALGGWGNFWSSVTEYQENNDKSVTGGWGVLKNGQISVT